MKETAKKILNIVIKTFGAIFITLYVSIGFLMACTNVLDPYIAKLPTPLLWLVGMWDKYSFDY